MLTGVHALIYSTDPEADRAFFRDVLGFPYVDNGGGWLIFKLPPAELGLHPADAPAHELQFMVDSIESTLADLRGKGIEVVGEPETRRYGIVATITLPSGAELMIYEPHHAIAKDL